MLETCSIFNRGGEILFDWCDSEEKNKQVSIEIIIKAYLINNKSCGNQLLFHSPASSSFIFNWVTHDEFDLIILTTYRKTTSFPYIHEFLIRVRDAFVQIYLTNQQVFAFPSIFDSIRSDFVEKDQNKNSMKKFNLAGSGLGDSVKNKLDFSSRNEFPTSKEIRSTENNLHGKKFSLLRENSGNSSNWLSEIIQGKLAKKLIGQTAFLESDFKLLIRELKIKLVKKNITLEIAHNICESVLNQLLHETVTSLSQVSKILDRVMLENLVQILSPISQIDILRAIQETRLKNQLYVILFVGVNGVGKSTSLSKIAYWIQRHKLLPMVAACDTFRAGAVEQLRTHCCRLNIPLYERGYEKDPTVIASEAIKQAIRLNVDVLLIDTAGRMQDNEPLMRALSKLINLSKPNLTLFVGEALIGNEASEQLKTFNQRLLDLIDEKKHNAVDGIILSKFDTVGDKIGAAISMVYANNIPIVFLGCGQTYSDLQRFDVDTFAKVLVN